MEDWLLFIVAVFGCYRITQLFIYDDGPFKVFFRLRLLVGVYNYDERGQSETWLGQLFSCPYCLGVWVALPLSFLFGFEWSILLWWMGIAGGQAFLESITARHPPIGS